MLLALLFLLFSASSVHADLFRSTSDAVDNMYFNTTALSIGCVPAFDTPENSLNYEIEDVYGFGTNCVLQGDSIFTLTTSYYLRRILGAQDWVSGPPETIVDYLYFYYNNTGFDINVPKLMIPFSKKDSSMGDFTNILNFGNDLPAWGSIPVLFNNHNLLKEAKFKEYNVNLVLQPEDQGSFILESMTITNPIEIVSIDIEEASIDTLRMSVLLENISNELLSNIAFKHNEYGISFNFNAKEQVLLEYYLPLEEDLGYFEIDNPNIRTECINPGTNYYNWLQPEAATLVAYREDGGWLNGAYVQPVGESMCITRIPYSMTSDILKYEKINDNIEEQEEVLGVSEPMVLDNIEILPNTAKKYEY